MLNTFYELLNFLILIFLVIILIFSYIKDSKNEEEIETIRKTRIKIIKVLEFFLLIRLFLLLTLGETIKSDAFGGKDIFVTLAVISIWFLYIKANKILNNSDDIDDSRE